MGKHWTFLVENCPQMNQERDLLKLKHLHNRIISSKETYQLVFKLNELWQTSGKDDNCREQNRCQV